MGEHGMPPDVDVERNVSAETRDGTELQADIYRPGGDGPWPVILMRLPYEKEHAENNFGTYVHPSWYARHGYMVVAQDTRGRYRSDGEFDPFHYEEEDGHDTVQWAAELPGSNGDVAMYGFSYSGATQLQAAVQQPDALETICPAITSGDFYKGWAYRGGAFALAFNASWSRFLAIDTAQQQEDDEAMQARAAEFEEGEYGYLPLEDFPGLDDLAPYFYDWIEHDSYDDFWQELSILDRYDQLDFPALHIGGWYDIFLDGTLRNYRRMREETDKPQKLIVGPWWHMPWSPMVGERDFGEEAQNQIDHEQLKWYDYWLKNEDNGYLDGPPVKLFVMGDNEWRTEEEWPLPRAEETRFYFHSVDRANSINGDGWLSTDKPGDESPDVYTYDPRNPTLSRGGRSCCYYEVAPMGPADQSENWMWNDILIYRTDPLDDPIEVTGPVSVTLYASSSAEDTDFVVKLVDIHPDGRVINVAEGILRARYRNSLEDPEPLEPSEVYELTIDLAATSNVFKGDHQIGVQIASSDFPQYDRNPNTGQSLGEYTAIDFTTATQTIFHDNSQPSHITLPIVPR